jgi:L-alanine-DL-glutamate epimerase-like enolase superfamily enzyme
VSVDVFGYRLRYAHGAYVMSGNRSIDALQSTVVRVRTDTGVTGWGETCPRGPTDRGAVAGGARAARAALAPETARLVERARAEIDSERRRSLQEVKATLADLTVAATEKVVRKQLDEAEQKRLIDEALADVDLSAFSTAQTEGDG